MLEITNLVTPSPEDWEATIKGMRLPFKSGDKSDSKICKSEFYFNFDESNYPQFCCTEQCEPPSEYFLLGENDEKLLLNLSKAGDPSHRKVLRQLPVKCFITAPLYWHKQMDQYKVSTVTQSESTMHVLTKYPFKVDDFSLGELADTDYYIESGCVGIEVNTYVGAMITTLNTLRDRYLETKDKKYWHAINRLLPQSYNQTRCWSGNYENLVTIINQRKNHKLGEWHTFCDFMLENVPYLKEINEAINES